MNRNQIRLRASSTLLALALGSCSDEPTAPQSPPPPGIIWVTVKASGGDIDHDYEVMVGNQQAAIRLSSTPTRFAAREETQTVRLQGVAANCTVTNQNPVQVTVPAGKWVEVRFEVDCAATGIRVTTRTSGDSEPATYSVTLGNQFVRNIGPNDSMLVSRLVPGTYTVSLTLPGSHCTTAGTLQRGVEVTNRSVTAVVFEVSCVPPIRVERIAYASLSASNPDTMISLVNPDGSSAVVLGAGNSPAWAPDGTKLAYANLVCEPYWGEVYCWGGLAVADPERRHVIDLSRGFGGRSPAWAPTGGKLAYIHCCSSASGGSTKDRLAIIGLDGAPSVQVPLPSLHAIGEPAWSPDGRRISFTCAVTLGDDDICVVNIDGSGFTQLTSEVGEDSKPEWSPDGSRIAFTTARFGARSVAIMNADGSGVTRITSGSQPSWSPDGSRLVYAGSDGLFTIHLDGSELKRLTTGNHFAPVWRP